MKTSVGVEFDNWYWSKPGKRRLHCRVWCITEYVDIDILCTDSLCHGGCLAAMHPESMDAFVQGAVNIEFFLPQYEHSVNMPGSRGRL